MELFLSFSCKVRHKQQQPAHTSIEEGEAEAEAAFIKKSNLRWFIMTKKLGTIGGFMELTLCSWEASMRGNLRELPTPR